jgi:hypothetical protein
MTQRSKPGIVGKHFASGSEFLAAMRQERESNDLIANQHGFFRFLSGRLFFSPGMPPPPEVPYPNFPWCPYEPFMEAEPDKYKNIKIIQRYTCHSIEIYYCSFDPATH